MAIKIPFLSVQKVYISPQNKMNKIEYNRKSIDKDVFVVSLDQHGRIIDIKDEETFLIFMANDKEVREVDIFDIRYI